MLATKLKGQITSNRKLIVELPRDLEPGAVEVILLRETPAKVVKPARRLAAHPAFGLWAKRTDVIDSADYAAQLRQQIEQGADRRG
jgi:hypothetical protein